MHAKKSRILLLPAFLPYPVIDGGKLCTFGFVDYLRRFYDFHLLVIVSGQGDLASVRTLQKLWPEVAFTLVNTSSGKVEQNIDPFYRRVSRDVVRYVRSFARRLRSKQLLRQYSNFPLPNPYEYYSLYNTTPFFPHSRAYVEALGCLLSNHAFDIIQSEVTQMLNLVHLFPTVGKSVFVQMENRSDVLYDYGVAKGIDSGYLNYVVSNTEFLECCYMDLYDAVLVLNEADKTRFECKLSSAKVYCSPFGILDKDILDSTEHHSPIRNLIFVGSENHYPNVDAVEWFTFHVLPLVRRGLIDKVFITGLWCEETKRKLMGKDDRLEFTGFVDDLGPYFKKCVSIVPIRIGGGGIRTKIITSMAQGSPVVSTSLAAVGVSMADHTDILIADTESAFAIAVTELLETSKLPGQIASNALRLVREKFGQSAVGEVRRAIYDELVRPSADLQA